VQALAARRSIASVILRPAMVHGYGGGIFGMLAGMVRQTGSVRVDGRKSLGPFADALALDQTVSGQHARRVLAWEPHGPGLIADLSDQKHFLQSNGA
jgi:hypothetical protein